MERMLEKQFSMLIQIKKSQIQFQGDSGGPLIVQQQIDGKNYWVEVGIASGIDPYSRLPSKLGHYLFYIFDYSALDFYARMSTYCDWIATVTKGSAQCID